MPKATSKAQQAWFYAAEKRGELSKGTARRHAKKGKAYKALPAYIRKKKKKRQALQMMKMGRMK